MAAVHSSIDQVKSISGEMCHLKNKAQISSSGRHNSTFDFFFKVLDAVPDT